MKVKQGSKVKFRYIKKCQNESFPGLIKYETENVSGVVLRVRDIRENPPSRRTMRDKSVERSAMLITLQTPDNKIKSFYDGKIIDLTVSESLISRIKRKIVG